MKLPEILNGSDMSFVRLLNASQVSVDLSLKSISSARIECRVEDAPVFGAWVKIYYPNGKFGVFRAGNPENDYSTGQSAVTLDHGTKTLSDNIVNVGDTYDDSGVAQPTYFEGTAAQVFAQLLSYQKTTFWRLGTVEVSDQIKIEVDFDNLLSKLNESLSQLEDCYFDYDQTSFPWTVNVRRIPTTVKAEGRLSRNISNVRIRYDDTDLCTRVYCESLDAGHLDSQYINVYGIREMRNQLTDVENADAVRICQRFLSIREKPRVGVTIDGGDFSALTGISLDCFVLGDLYRLVIPARNIVLTDQITALNYPDIISSPYMVSLTLGAERNDLSASLAQTKTKADTSSYSASKAGTNVMHVYEELKKEAIVTTNHGKVLRSAGIEFDENGVLLFAKEMGIDKGAGYVHAETGQTSVPMYTEESTSSAVKMRIPDGAQVVIKQRGETWSKVYYDRHEGYVLTDRIETRVNLSGAFNVTAERLTSDYTNAVANVESHLTQTASQIRGEVDDYNENLSGRLSVMAREVKLVTGSRYDDAHRKPYRNRNSFPAQGQAGYLYIDNSTKTYYVWENGAYVGTIDEPLVNAAGIVSSINNDGTSSTRILGTKVTVGNTVDASTLPDWADATEGLIAQKATIVDLNAVRARVGTLEADAITASTLDSNIGNLNVVHVKSIQPASGTTNANLALHSVSALNRLYIGSGQNQIDLIDNGVRDAVTDLDVTLSGNTYTLKKKTIASHASWTDVATFSRATTLSGEYGGDNTGDTATYKVTATPQGSEITGSFKVKENKNSAWIEDANGTIRARIDNPEWNNGGKTAAIASVTPTSGQTASMVLGFGTQYLITPKYTNKSGSAVNTGNTYVIQSPAFPSVTLDCDSVGDEDYDVAGNVYAKANGSTRATKQITITKGAIKDNGKMAMNAYCDGTRVNRTWATFSAAKLYADHYDSTTRRYYFYSTINITSSNRTVVW